jgi:hypothetical protein
MMALDKCKEVVALHHKDICETVWVSWRSLFLKKMLPNGKKDLKTVKRKAQNQRKKIVTAEKHFTGTITSFPLEANGSLQTPTRSCFAKICCPGSLSHILIKIRISSCFPCRKIAARWQIAVLSPYLLPLKSLDYSTRDVLKSKCNAMPHQKMGSL